jgi:hypothetical protein
MKPTESNQDTRTEFAQLLRALFTGRITNDDFDEKAIPLALGRDFTIAQIFWVGAWPSYSDNRVYKLIGPDALSRKDKKIVARWILFLKSGLPYSWPKYPCLPTWLILLLIFLPIPIAYFLEIWFLTPLGFILAGFATYAFDRIKAPAFKKCGDFAVWPFISKADFEEALRHPPYLAGTNSPNGVS